MLAVLWLCYLLEFGSEMWICIFRCAVQPGVFVVFGFNVVVGNSVVAQCGCLGYLICVWFVCFVLDVKGLSLLYVMVLLLLLCIIVFV